MGRKKKAPKQLAQLPLDIVILKKGVSADDYPEDEIGALARSIAENGLEEPILVKEGAAGGPHLLLAGTRRFLAVKRLGWEQIEALLLDRSLDAEIRLIEKLQTQPHDPWTSVDALVHLKDKLDWTQNLLGQAIGRNRDFVANLLAIAQITPETRAFILAQKNGTELSTRHLRYVGRAPRSEQIQVAQRILMRKLSTTTLERTRRSDSRRVSGFRFQNLRALPAAGGAGYPKTLKEWRRYHRQLKTDLSRLGRQEEQEVRRTRKQIADARKRLRLIRAEAARKKKELQRELRRALKQLGLRG